MRKHPAVQIAAGAEMPQPRAQEAPAELAFGDCLGLGNHVLWFTFQMSAHFRQSHYFVPAEFALLLNSLLLTCSIGQQPNPLYFQPSKFT